MKNKEWKTLAAAYLTPAILILVGLILIVNPDTATAMVGKIIGWVLTLVGAGAGILAATEQTGRFGRIVLALVCVVMGIRLLSSPLVLAETLGRLFGILLVVRGIQDIQAAAAWKHGMLTAVLTALMGVILILVPLTTSRLVMMAVGGVVLVIGVLILMDRMGMRRRLKDSDDPNIIDAL